MRAAVRTLPRRSTEERAPARLCVAWVPMRCLGDNTVTEFAEGLLSAGAAARVEAHIATCSACRRLLSELAKQLSGVPTGEPINEGGGAETKVRPPLDLWGSAGRVGGGGDESDTPVLAEEGEPGEALRRGDRLGRYMVLESIGQGGMGVVLAAYDPELDRKVALKLLRAEVLGMSRPATLRLMREAQAMARLSHPNVVAVYDVGLVGGSVFFAMELVPGETLTKWLSSEKRPWRAVVDVFVQTGRGLSAAHAAGLVHRDFKPDNVLVGRDGRVRVTDFGLSRALTGDEGQEQSPADPASGSDASDARASVDEARTEAFAKLTRDGAVLGTPAYMAPEQLEGAAVDARADQWSFCVALFEALYGARPFEVGTREAVLREAPGGKLRPPKDAPAAPAHVLRVLERGLSASPGDRFPSMDALLHALTQHERRALGKRVIAALAAGALGLGVFAVVRAGEPSPALCRGAEEAFAEAFGEAKKRAIRERFLATGRPYAEDTWRAVERAVDTYGRGWSAMRAEACEATRVRGEQSDEVLSLRMICLDRRLAEVRALAGVLETAGEAEVQKAVEAAGRLGDLSICADVEALRAPVRLPEQIGAAIEAEEVQRQVAHAAALRSTGRFKEGLVVAKLAAARAEALGHAPTEAEALDTLGDLESAAGDAKAAEGSLRRAFSSAQAGRHDRSAASAAVKLALVVGSQARRYDEGLEWGWLAEVVLRRVGKDDILLAQLAANRGGIYLEQGEYPRAAEEQERALVLWERAVGPDHPSVAVAMFNVSQAAIGQGDMDKAVSLSRRSTEILERALGAHHPNVAWGRNGVAAALLNQGRYAEARDLARQALAAAEPALGPEHVRVGRILVTLGHALQPLHENEEAVAAYRRALSIFDKDESAASLAVQALLGLANAQADMGRQEDALATHEKALEIAEKVFGPENDQVGACLDNVGQTLLSLGRPKEAGPLFERARAVWEKANGPDDYQIGIALTGLGKVERQLKRPAQAAAVLERAIKQLEGYNGNPVFVALARFELAQALMEVGPGAGRGGGRERAKSLAAEAEQAFVEAGEAEAKELARVRAWLGAVASR